jgi:hypothetical protein
VLTKEKFCQDEQKWKTANVNGNGNRKQSFFDVQYNEMQWRGERRNEKFIFSILQM